MTVNEVKLAVYLLMGIKCGLAVPSWYECGMNLFITCVRRKKNRPSQYTVGVGKVHCQFEPVYKGLQRILQKLTCVES